MGIFSIANQHLRFAIKLAFAIVLALFVGFHFQLETPRWAVLTAAIVAAGPAFAAGGEPYSGAIRYRGMLRIVGTFIGCIAALTIVILMIRTPLLMLMVCCIWAGFCTWISSLVRVENSYAWGLSGYTALIIIITIQANPLLAPQFAVERCSEIVLGDRLRDRGGSALLSPLDQTGGGSRAGCADRCPVSTHAAVHRARRQ